MNVIETAIPGVLIVEPKVFGDTRGFFMELYQAERYGGSGITPRSIVSRTCSKTNASSSSARTLRRSPGWPVFAFTRICKI